MCGTTVATVAHRHGGLSGGLSEEHHVPLAAASPKFEDRAPPFACSAIQIVKNITLPPMSPSQADLQDKLLVLPNLGELFGPSVWPNRLAHPGCL